MREREAFQECALAWQNELSLDLGRFDLVPAVCDAGPLGRGRGVIRIRRRLCASHAVLVIPSTDLALA